MTEQIRVREWFRLANDRPEAEPEPCGCDPGAHDNGDPGGFYVTVQDGKRTGWLLGPYATHGEALDRVRDGKALAEAANSRACFYAFGTSRILDAAARPDGILNALYARWQDGLLAPGTLVQYRKVGRGTVQAHVCPSYAGCAGLSQHCYSVAFETGRYRGTTVEVWLHPQDVTTRPARGRQA